MLAHEQFGVERFRPSAEPFNSHDLAALGVVDHDRRDAGDVDQVALQNTKRDPGGAARVDRVAACFENREPRGGGGEIMAGGNGVAGHRDGRTVRKWCGHGRPSWTR